jgi:chromosome segregation ATPase
MASDGGSSLLGESGEETLQSRFDKLQTLYNEQNDILLKVLKEKKDLEKLAQKSSDGSFSVSDVIDAKKEIIRLQQKNHDLHSKLNSFEMEHGHTKDELEDAKLTQSDLKSQIRDLNNELDESRTSLATAKQMAAKFEALSEDAEGRLSEATNELADVSTELKHITELYRAVEKEAKLIKEHKAKMREKDRAINKLQRQLKMVTETSSRRLNSTQNSLQSNQQLLAELRAEYEEFYSITEQEWDSERQVKDQEYERLEKAHHRLLSLQFEDKQHMLREHQAIVKALQTQFQEYRRTAENLFKHEANKLEGKLHIQMEEYEEELRYVIRMKDKAFDEMIACKDAKILTLIEGTDFQQLLIRHELEKEQMRRTQYEDMSNARREWQAQQAKLDDELNKKQLKQEIEIKELVSRLGESETLIERTMDMVRSGSQKVQDLHHQHQSSLEAKHEEIAQWIARCEKLKQEKLNLRHRVVLLKHKQTGFADENVESLVTRMQKEMNVLAEKFEKLTADYSKKASEASEAAKKRAGLEEKVRKLEQNLGATATEKDRLSRTFEKYLQTAKTVANSPRKANREPQHGNSNSPYIKREIKRIEKSSKKRGQANRRPLPGPASVGGRKLERAKKPSGHRRGGAGEGRATKMSATSSAVTAETAISKQHGEPGPASEDS